MSWLDEYNDYHDETQGDHERNECGSPISASEYQDGGTCGTCLQDRDCD